MAFDWTTLYAKMVKKSPKNIKTKCGTNTCPALRHIIESKYPYTRIDAYDDLENEKIPTYQGNESLEARITTLPGDIDFMEVRRGHKFKNLEFADKFGDMLSLVGDDFFHMEQKLEEGTRPEKGGWDTPEFKQAVRDADYKTTSAYHTSNFHNYIENHPIIFNNILNGLKKVNYSIGISHPTEKTHGKITYSDKNQVLFDNTKKVKK